jgi:thiaminase
MDVFEGVVNYLRDQLDKAWVDLDDQQREKAEEMFGKAVACEVDFFNASYQSRS